MYAVLAPQTEHRDKCLWLVRPGSVKKYGFSVSGVAQEEIEREIVYSCLSSDLKCIRKRIL